MRSEFGRIRSDSYLFGRIRSDSYRSPRIRSECVGEGKVLNYARQAGNETLIPQVHLAFHDGIKRYMVSEFINAPTMEDFVSLDPSSLSYILLK